MFTFAIRIIIIIIVTLKLALSLSLSLSSSLRTFSADIGCQRRGWFRVQNNRATRLSYSLRALVQTIASCFANCHRRIVFKFGPENNST